MRAEKDTSIEKIIHLKRLNFVNMNIRNTVFSVCGDRSLNLRIREIKNQVSFAR